MLCAWRVEYSYQESNLYQEKGFDAKATLLLWFGRMVDRGNASPVKVCMCMPPGLVRLAAELRPRLRKQNILRKSLFVAVCELTI